jgi:hypothetical protein
MPHPADHPAAALAITRGLPGQLQKAKANGDLATAAAIEHALARARRIVANGSAPPRQDRPPPARQPPPPPPPEEGWAEIVMDRRSRRW